MLWKIVVKYTNALNLTPVAKTVKILGKKPSLEQLQVRLFTTESQRVCCFDICASPVSGTTHTRSVQAASVLQGTKLSESPAGVWL
jgi:hypothetical protein